MNILAISPHTDDVELGCGSTIAKFVQNGHKVRVIALSYLFGKLPYENLTAEFNNSMNILEVTDYTLYNFQERKFNEQRQSILETLVKENKKFNPSIVFVPLTTDYHQDHETVSKESLRAFRTSTILGYELPWNNMTSILNYFITVSATNVRAKEKALQQYKSQRHKLYFKNDYASSLAKIRGIAIEQSYAEAFELIRGVE